MTVRQRGDRTWQIRVSAGNDPVTGVRRIVSETVHGSKRSALQREAKLKAEHSRAGRRSAVTLDTCITEWAAHRPLADATRDNVKRTRTLIPPAMAATPVERLSGRDFDQLYRTLETKAVGRETIRTFHKLVNAALNQAIKWGWLIDNPASRATPPRAVKSKAGAFTATELDKLKAQLGQPEHLQFAAWLRLVYITGGRRSEILAIRWTAIDHAAGTLTIDVALNRNRTVKDTKTHAARTFTLDAETLTMIRKWQIGQRERALKAGTSLDPNPYLFSHALNSDTPWRPDSTSRMFGRLCKTAGLSGRTLHDLRHTNASELLAAGTPIKVVQERLGHASPITTLGMYAHVLEHADQAAADHLGTRFGS